mgnify:CR=1 FL=1
MAFSILLRTKLDKTQEKRIYGRKSNFSTDKRGIESNQIKDVLLTADLYGIESHGMQRMVRYHKGIEKGTIHPQAKPEVVFETPISAVIDGHNGMGQLISVYAMKKAIEKVLKTKVVELSVDPQLMGALGAAEFARKKGGAKQ